MSKEPTSKGRLEGSDEANARRRRRRRGGGLRVPSDKVPRASSQGDSELGEPPEPPEPEAPELAVSVASAFGGEDEQEELEQEPSGGGAEPQSASDPEAEESGEDAPDEEGDAPAEGGGDGGGGDGGDDAPGEEAGAARDSGKTQQVAAEEPGAASDDEEATRGADAPGAGGAAESSEAGDAAAAGVAAVDSAHEIEEEDTPDAESDEEERVGYDSVDIPIEDDAAPQRRMPRAQTEALSEEELEELMEPMEDEEAGAPQEEKEGADDGDVDFDARETAQFVPVVIEEPEEESAGPASDSETGAEDDAVPTAVTHLERRGIDAPDAEGGGGAEARDAGDSGEILSDELVEEIEDAGSGAASAAPSAAAFDVSGPVESGRGAPLLGAEEYQEVKGGEVREQEATARAADPPPVPDASPAAKPPPAPAAASGVTSQADKGVGSSYGRAWFDEIFDEDYLRTLPFLTPQATQAEAKFVAEAIAAAPGAQVLDVGCGYGRHAMELAARGLHVVGLDSSLPLLLRGADEAQRRGLTIHFVHGDMRELTFESQFDAAYCLFSTFGYFDDETNKKTAQNIARALKPGARFVIEVLNRDYLIQDLPTRVWWEGDGCVVLEEVDFNYFSSRIVSNRSVVFDDGRQLEQEISIRAYSLHELGKLLHAAGFRVLEVSGSMNTRGRFFGARARDIIVVAEKRGSGS